jgi:hypothetical protein
MRLPTSPPQLKNQISVVPGQSSAGRAQHAWEGVWVGQGREGSLALPLFVPFWILNHMNVLPSQKIKRQLMVENETK